MNAIICLKQYPKNNHHFFHKMMTPPVTKKQASCEGNSFTIYSLNPFYHRKFPRLISAIRKQHSTLYFCGELKQYPKIYHELPLEDYFFRQLPRILSKISVDDISEIGILCQKEDPRLIPLLEMLDSFTSVVSILTEEDHFFDKVSSGLLLSRGLTLNQKNLENLAKKQFLILLNGTAPSPQKNAPRCIDLRNSPSDTPTNTLSDFTSEAVTDFFHKQQIATLKHCYFVPKEEKNIKLIWKITKKS